MPFDSINYLQKLLHRKAQYLAAFNNSYLPWEKDDSHSNMEWISREHLLGSRQVENHSLQLSYDNFSLVFNGPTIQSGLDLVGKSHDEIHDWLINQLNRSSLDPGRFAYRYSYSLQPFKAELETWTSTIRSQLSLLSLWRSVAQKALEQVGKDHKSSEIRIWPHHFDTGMLIDGGEHFNMGIGLGYAMADSISKRPYYYAYSWGMEIPFHDLENPAYGTWHINDWKGAVLPVHPEITRNQVFSFYQSAADLMMQTAHV